MFTFQGDRQVRANAVYPQAARLNHACMPNVARFDYVVRLAATNSLIYSLIRRSTLGFTSRENSACVAASAREQL